MALPKWLAILELFGPQILQFTPLAPIAGLVVKAIGEAEAMRGATGEQKLKQVQAITATAAEAVNAQTGETTIKPEVVSATAGALISDIVNVVNIVHDAHTTSSKEAAKAPPKP